MVGGAKVRWLGPGGGDGGATGEAWQSETERPNKRHCRCTGA